MTSLDGKLWTGILTRVDELSAGTNSITVSTTFDGVMLNKQLQFEIDTVNPTLTMILSQYHFTINQTATLTIYLFKTDKEP